MKLTTLLNSVLIITSIAFVPGIAGAQTVNNNNGGQVNTDVNSNTLRGNPTETKYLQPFNIAFLAYQGYLKEQGIPSGGTLLFKYQTGYLTAKNVVKAAIRANKLPAKVLNDQGYVNAVELQMKSFGDTNDSL
ncbi:MULTISPECIES: hypothetical protein [unclassified Nostoc]|uniref:hypothetical protein n=1 Tax=unclassified Nostoc TaxID=2593658 RepID=UPI002AD30F92|nr:hypothetical protein [Nostoc sp. DedQUE03]MDZ7973450.1 hypothetical protein [Nostoc sp. DedQUE03]MDZ8045066.1 hypothetical protein [Nostoc sp. DedQUE02]